MSCTDISCIPNIVQLNEMVRAGYKFKIDGKQVNTKKIADFMKTGGVAD
jgi:hypothetical protein